MALTKIDDRGLKTPIDLLDNEKIRFGTGNDLEIYHNASNSLIENTTGNLIIKDTTGSVYVQSAGIYFQDDTTNENIARFIADGAVELYYNNSKKFETTDIGVQATGHIFSTTKFRGNDDVKVSLGTSEDLQIYHDGSHSYIDNTNGTGNIYIKDEIVRVRAATSFAVDNADGTETSLMATLNGAVDLYYNNAKKLETTSSGIAIAGDIDVNSGGNIFCEDNGKIRIGTSDDLQIYHDASNSYIANTTGNLIIKDTTGTIYLQSTRIDFESEDGEQIAHFISDGAVELYYDNVKTFQTNTDGIIVQATEGGDANLFLYADEGDDDVDKWLIQSESDGYFALKNNASGSYEISIKATGNGNVELYYDNTWRFKTESWGVSVNGNLALGDNEYLNFGGNNDLQIYHDASNSRIHDGGTGVLAISGSQVHIQNAAQSETCAKFIEDGAVELYHNNVKKLETASTGINIGVSSPQYAKPVNIQGGNGATLSLSNQDYTGNDADTWSGIEGRIQCGNSVWGTSGVRFKKANGTAEDKHTKLELYVTDGYANQTGLIVNPDGEVTKPLQPSFVARAGAGRNDVTGTITFTSCDSGWNVSGSYDTSNSRFTAPVAGWYHFGGQAGYKETDDNYNVKFMVNGAYQFEVARVIGGSNDDSWQSHSTFAWSQIYKLAKDDYVSLETAYEMHQNSTYSSFWGYLIK